MNSFNHFTPFKSIAITLFVFGSMCLIMWHLVLGMDKFGPFDVDGSNVGGIILRSQNPTAFRIVEISFGFLAFSFYTLAIYFKFFKQKKNG